MKKIVLSLFILCFGSSFAMAQTLPDADFARAKVLTIEDQGTQNIFGSEQLFQKITAKLINGKNQGQTITIEPEGLSIATEKQFLREGETIIVSSTHQDDIASYYVVDTYRLPALVLIFIFFLGVTILLGKKRGTMSIVGLAFSILVIAQFIIPQILAGNNPLLVSFFGSLVIATISLYVSHGFEKRTTVALVSTIFTLFIAFIFSAFFVKWTRLFGLGTEEAFYLQLDMNHVLNMQGLLLGGIVIGTIGVLDDVTTTQSATVDELLKANPSLSVRELFTRGMSVGHEHIASLINTLALAYTGAALPLFLLTQINDIRPLWVIINSEFIAEEIVRTISGSLALVLAVPISTYLAAVILKKKKTAS